MLSSCEFAILTIYEIEMLPKCENAVLTMCEITKLPMHARQFALTFRVSERIILFLIDSNAGIFHISNLEACTFRKPRGNVSSG